MAGVPGRKTPRTHRVVQDLTHPAAHRTHGAGTATSAATTGTAHNQWGEDGHPGEDGGRRCHHHHHYQGSWGGGGHGQGEGPGHGGMIFRDLNLTPEQHQKIRIIVMSARLDAMKQAGTHKPDDMAALMNPGDPNYKAAVEAAKKRATDRIQRMSDVQQQIYNVLTPEQKTELGKRIADWKTRMAQRQQNPKGPPAPAVR